MPMPVLDVQKAYCRLLKLLTTSTTAFCGLRGLKLEERVSSGSRSSPPSAWALSWMVRALRRVKAFLIRSPVFGRIKVACRSYKWTLA